MENIIGELTTFYNNKMTDVIDEYNKLKQLKNSIDKNNFDLVNQNYELKKRIDELIEEKKSKSSSTLWESTQKQLKEKDFLIEQLKKDIEFYKRQSTKTNLMDKYPYNPNKDINENTYTNENNDNNETKQIKETIDANEIKSKKKKEKSKDKTDKKKKKEVIKINDDDDDDVNELEKELLGFN